MQISTIHYKNLNEELRFDAEYFRQDVVEKIALISKKGKKQLGELVKFIVGPFGSTVTTDKYVDYSDFTYIRNKDIQNFEILDQELAYVSKELYDGLPQFHLHRNDLLVTVVGTLGKAAIFQDKNGKAIFSCKSTAIRTNSISPYYLLAYLNSDTGQILTLRGERGAIQPGLNLSDLKSIDIYTPSRSFEIFVAKIVKEALELSNKVQETYQHAENILITAMDLNEQSLQNKLVFTRSYSFVKSADRFDAEYYQPKFDSIVDSIKKYKCKPLIDLVTITKSIEVGSNAYTTEGIPYIRVSNLTKYGITSNNQQYVDKSLYDQLQKYQPQKGEVLLSKDATPGIAYLISEPPQKMLLSGGILRLRVNNEEILPEYLTLVLNSLIVQKQIERDAGGSIIVHWLLDQVENTLIPIPEVDIQKEISGLIRNSFEAREQSTKLLEIAKTAVEFAITDSEEEATKWIESQLESLGLDIS